MKQSRLIYKISCSQCDDFYIGMTKRRLITRVNEHKKDEYSALFKHSCETGHIVDYSSPEIISKDSLLYRLQIKETLKIQEAFAYKSLNGNSGSLMLKLWWYNSVIIVYMYTLLKSIHSEVENVNRSLWNVLFVYISLILHINHEDSHTCVCVSVLAIMLAKIKQS